MSFIETIRQVLFRRTYWRESLVIFVSLITLMLLYTFRIGDYAGVAVGFRWLIPPMPLIILFAGVLLDRALSRRNLALFLIFMFCIAFGAQQWRIDGRPWMRSRWTTLYTNKGIKAYPIRIKGTANKYLPPKMRLQ